MIRILDDNKMGDGTRMYETPYDLYIDNIEYKKQDMYHTPFKCFNDGNTINNISFNQGLSPYTNRCFYNGLKNDSILVDNQDANITYITHFYQYGDSSYSWQTGHYGRIGVVDKNNNTKILYISHGNYTLNRHIVKFLGQTDTKIYIVVVGTYEGGNGSYNTPNYYYNQSHSYGSLETKIIAIEKKELLKRKRNQYLYYNHVIASFPRSYGDIKIIKETDTEIYCLASIFDDNGNQYEIFKINKTSDSYSSITKFYQEYDYYQRSDIVTPSDIIEIDDDNYEFYLTLMEKGEQVDGQSYFHHKYYLYKCKFTLSTNSLEKTKMIINEDELPYFGCSVGNYYNAIYHFENNGINYLITSTNVFYQGNKKHNLEDNIISYYKVNGQDTLTCTLLDKIKAKDISGDFYGMLFNKKDKIFLAMTNQTSYMFDFSSEKIKTIDLKNRPKEIGIDLEGNYYGSNDDKSVYIYGKHKVSNIVLTPPDIPDEVTYPYQTNIKMNAYNYEGTKIKLPVKLVIVGDNATFDDNSSNILIKNSEIDSDVSIPITITNDSIFEVYAEVERDEVI